MYLIPLASNDVEYSVVILMEVADLAEFAARTPVEADVTKLPAKWRRRTLRAAIFVTAPPETVQSAITLFQVGATQRALILLGLESREDAAEYTVLIDHPQEQGEPT